MNIYNINGERILDVDVDDSSYRHRTISGEHNLILKYALPEYIELPVGSYCFFQGEKYTLERPESFKMKHTHNFEYNVTMEAYQAKAKIWKFRNTVDGRLKFSLTAKPIEHLQMLIDNMNRRDAGWTAGECVDGPEQLINYDHNFCWDALTKQASEFKTEFEIVGKRVSLKKVEYNKNNPLPLSYGRGQGFKSGLGRSNSGGNPPVEILYVQGGTDNIDRSKYGNSELLLPKKQSIFYDGEYFEDEQGFNTKNARRYIVDDYGLSLHREDKQLSSFAEDSLNCSSIYPKRVGVVSNVTVVNASKNFYDIEDNSIPETLNYEDCLIAGETMTIIFQSGMLAGREFEVKYKHKPKNDKPGKRFEIVPQEIDGVTMPNSTFAPKIGDKYAVFKCMLPQAYICDNSTKSGAEWDMFKTAVKYMFDNEEQKFTFTGELDGIWAKKDWVNIGGRIVLGGYILFSDERFQKEGVLLRITAIKDYINNPHSPVIEISNNIVSGGFSSDIKKLQSEEVLIEEKHKEALQYTKRRFRDAKETISMLEESLLDNYSTTINPIAVQTMSMLVGDESLQFRFVEIYNDRRVVVDHIFNYNSETKIFSTNGGIIQHLTLNKKELSSQNRGGFYIWRVTDYNSARLDDENKRYYLYIKADATGSRSGEFLLSENAIKMDSVDGYYHFLVGVLNSEYNGDRSFIPLYGYTEISPGRMTTDRIISGNGDSYFDMLANSMKLGSVLDFNSKGDGKLRLRGTLVQSGSGDESYIGCYRGEYNDNSTYYSGDEVSFLDNGTTSKYRYINKNSSSGHKPTDTKYWQLISGGANPTLVYRGVYDKSKTYYGNKQRVDCVKQGNEYYTARVDAGTFSTPAPPDSSKWNSFGASFESVATNLLLAEGANIGDWFISEGKIVSTLEDDANKIILDAKKSKIKVLSKDANATYQAEHLEYIDPNKKVKREVTIDIDAFKGQVETRDNGNNIAYISPAGIFANNAGTRCTSGIYGRDHRASIVGLGFSDLSLDKSDLAALNLNPLSEYKLVAGVYGSVRNSGTAPSYGGYFNYLKANGLILNQRIIKNGDTEIYETDSFVIGLGYGEYLAFLPASSRIGLTIFFKQIGSGTLTLSTKSRQVIGGNYNGQYFIRKGETVMMTLTKIQLDGISGEMREFWITSKF